MHFCRRLIALLLIVTLPAYAWAALGLPESCTMQSTPAPMADAAYACCELTDAADDVGSPRTSEGTPCKAGQQCNTGSLYPLQVARTLRVCLPQDALAAPAEISIFASNPSGIWRPPRVL